MKEIAEVDYKDMDFVFITDHYDLHLGGLCRYNGKLCYFETYDEMYEEENPLYYKWWTDPKGVKHQYPIYRWLGRCYCKIYSLTLKEWADQLISRWWFEFCLGYHWSYPQRKNHEFTDWKPRWLRKTLYYAYYHSKGFHEIGWPKYLAGDEIK